MATYCCEMVGTSPQQDDIVIHRVHYNRVQDPSWGRVNAEEAENKTKIIFKLELFSSQGRRSAQRATMTPIETPHLQLQL